ncbi:Npt1/Npt2 family nucleotide transporter [Lewinella sp. 4G2]|uniref:Npt1/Npt2 family nucleotide transporter n=1 Tax=Lewinella sp. 4G2 TaxID=1803372 RepID=UPI0012FA8EBC|nr:Npt1/Npt2 family nucleotide transporter [Lewinella sp. 4G2]
MRPGEWGPVLLLQLQIFLIIAVLLITKPVGSAYFVNRFGADALPYAYIATAIAAAIVSTLYSFAVKYFSILRVNLWSLGICMSTLLLCVFLIPMRHTEDFVAVALYLWVALFGVLAASQFWSIASMVFDIRQAKRLFGPIGAGAIAGGIAGGYLASILAEAVGIRILLIIAASMLIPVLLISYYVWRRYVLRRTGTRSQPSKKDVAQKEPPHKLILSSRHLLLLCGIIGFSVITAKLVDYQFSALASARYADTDRLAAFFGFWFSTFNVVGLLIQLLLTQRVLQRLGVSGSLLFLPAGLGLGAIIMLIIPTLGAAVFSRCVDGSLKQSLHRAGVEMLYLPVDAHVKKRIKTYIDVLIDSAAGGIGGLLLLFMINSLGLRPAHISPFVLLFALCWLGCVLAVKEEYLDAFRHQLAHLRPKITKVKKTVKQNNHGEVLSGFLKVLEAGGQGATDTEKLLYVLDRTENLKDSQFLKPTEQLLFHENPVVKARALHNLSVSGAVDIYDLVVFMLEDKELVVKKAALEYLINNHLSEAEAIIKRQLNHDDPEIAGLALIDLLIETDGNRTLRKRWKLEDVFAEKVLRLDEMPSDLSFKWRLHLLVAAGRSGSTLGNQFIARELKSSNPEVVRVAIIATGESLAERWLLPLIDFLSKPAFRKHATAALIKYDLAFIKILPKYLREAVIDVVDMRRIPSVIERIPDAQTVALLFSMMDKYHPMDLELRMEVLKSLNAIRRDYPSLGIPKRKVVRYLKREAKKYRLIQNLYANQQAVIGNRPDEVGKGRQALVRLLKKRKEGGLDRLFRLLGLYYSPEDIIPIYRGLVKAGPGVRTSALEFLDNLLDTDLKQIIIPLVETEVRDRLAVTHGNSGLSGGELRVMQNLYFSTILKGKDQRLKAAVLFILANDPQPDLTPLIQLATKSPHAKVRKLAGQALAQRVTA